MMRRRLPADTRSARELLLGVVPQRSCSASMATTEPHAAPAAVLVQLRGQLGGEQDCPVVHVASVGSPPTATVAEIFEASNALERNYEELMK
jgi:hypothetical protein